MNYNNDDISIGRALHEKAYSRENKEIRIDNLVFDFVKNDDGLVVFEMKKSSKLTIGAKYQLYFYMYVLRHIEPDIKGVLTYPKERKREELKLDDNILKEMDEILNGILKIADLDKPPLSKMNKYCKNCSFYELYGLVIIMKNPSYITSHGILSRKDNTLYFISDDVKKQIPIHAISEINCFGKVSLKSGASSFLMKEGIVVNFFNGYGFYEGSLYPKIKLNSGLVVVKQSEHYLNNKKRRYIAKEFVEGIKHNVLKTMKYYSKKGKNISEFIDNIEKENIDGDILQIMSCEGRIWNNFYQSFNEILRKFSFNKREIRPPTDEINSLLSFGNSLLYTTVLSELYQTYIHPSVSFLHEPSERRFSLSLDIADIFKPIIVDRTIFKLVNNNKLSKKHFSYDVGCLLNEKGKQIFISEYQKKLETTIMHKTLNKKVSYKYLIRLEGYKLIKHFLNDKKYESFKMWW